MTKKSKYLDIFCREADEHLASLQQGLLALEKEPANAELIHELLRNAHTLKGSAQMLGFADISAIGHRMEDLLKDVEGGKRQVSASVIDLLLKGNDAISRMMRALTEGQESPVNIEQFVAAFDRGEFTGEEIKESQTSDEVGIGETVRAKVTTLDSLVNLVGELIINQRRFENRSASLKRVCAGTGNLAHALELQDFSRGLEEDVLYHGYLIQELHGKAMALRMLPLKTITEEFQRMVRDLAREQGKEAELVVTGENIELDRVLLGNLKPMLLHMLRNSIDHGLESAEERLMRGKPAQGTIWIAARYDGNRVRVDLRDDGRGIDPLQMKQTALQRGVIDKEEADLLSDDEALYLILRPGFSTSEEVTDLSGRGVGMDVVKNNIEQVKGTLALTSEVGQYTEITLHLPLTLSVIEALLLVSASQSFAVPLNYVQETMKIRGEEIASVGGKDVITVRGVTTPLVSLATMLGLPEKKGILQGGKIAVVILKFRGHCLACSVDENIGSSEIVVKGLGMQLKSVAFISGATILGDGEPALILNVPDLFASAEGASTGKLRQAFEESLAVISRGKVLVVDDSITTRTMERSILLSHGYEVEIAISGEDALEKVAGRRFDLVISDIEMPGINGFELTKRLRGLEEYREVPIMIVSSLSRDEDKRKAMEAGAQAYIIKGSFEQGALLDTVESLIG